MNRYTLTLAFLVLYHLAWAQDEFFPFVDFHIHPTFKHYNRPRKPAEMNLILDGTDTSGGILRFSDALKQYFRKSNAEHKAYSADSADNWKNYILAPKKK